MCRFPERCGPTTKELEIPLAIKNNFAGPGSWTAYKCAKIIYINEGWVQKSLILLRAVNGETLKGMNSSLKRLQRKTFLKKVTSFPHIIQVNNNNSEKTNFFDCTWSSRNHKPPCIAQTYKNLYRCFVNTKIAIQK